VDLEGSEVVEDLDEENSEDESVNRIIARKIAEEVWGAIGYRFMCVVAEIFHITN
jgi:hypothetical protein